MKKNTGTAVVRYPAEIISSSSSSCTKSVITLGNFDGLHLGHQSLVKKVVNEAADLEAKSVLLSLYPHPRQVLTNVTTKYILNLRTKLELLSELGINYLYLLHFTSKIRSLLPEEFLTEVVLKKLNPVKVIVGEDAAVGRNRAGNVEFMHKYFFKNGINFEVFPYIGAAGCSKISSTQIREYLESGEVEQVGELIGRTFTLSGKVRSGDQRGRLIGYPTANLSINHQLLPQSGVYLTNVNLKNQQFRSLTNIGVRPTFNGDQVLVESYLINYSGPEFYGEKINIEFLKKIRSEQKFATLEDLQLQIKKDLEFANRYMHENL